MKRLIILIILLLPLSSIAQEITFTDIMSEYSSKEGCTTMRIGNSLFRSMEIDIDADSMYIISVENHSLIPHFKAQIETLATSMEVLMSVNHSSESVNIYQLKSDGQIKEILIVTSEKDVCAAIYIIGTNLVLNQIDSLINLF